MKKAAAILLFSVYSITVLKPYLPLINYALNKTQIVSQFCENKDKPKLHCEGKCHLKKELKKASKEDSRTPQVLKMSNEQISTAVKENNLSHIVTAILNDVLISNYLEPIVSTYLPKVFEPPRHT